MQQHGYQLSESLITRWCRRFISISAIALATSIVLVSSPLWLVIAISFDAIQQLFFKRRTSAIRGGLFISWHLFCECYGILCSFILFVAYLIRPNRQQFITWNYQLQAHWASMLWRGVLFCFQLKIEVDDQAEMNQQPFLLLLRHTSIADTLLASIFVTVPHKVNFRYVMKRELLWDPCLDIVGQRVPNCFVNRGSNNIDDELEAIASLTTNLMSHEGLLIYPEGTRFTEAKRRRIIEKHQHNSQVDIASQAEQLQYLLPPKYQGVYALLEKNLGLDVVIANHVGLEQVTELKQLWNGGMLNAAITIKFHRIANSELPTTKDDCVHWLFQQWLAMDKWIADNR